LIQWLLNGHPIESYPGWSRAIVCANNTQVLHLAHAIHDATQQWEGAWDLHTLTALRKAIWSIGDLKSTMRGMKLDDFEYAIDNADMILAQVLGAYSPPAIITMTGVIDA
jgi:hypothetical protein